MTTQIKGNDTSTFGGNIDVTGNVVTDAPAFRAYTGANQSVSPATATKVNFDTEEFDTNSCYDTTNKRFTPTTEGYYQINASAYWLTAFADQKQTWISIYKNGSSIGYGSVQNSSGTNDGLSPSISQLVYMNGSTDYLEIYIRQGDTVSRTVFGSSTFAWFTGHLVRAV